MSLIHHVAGIVHDSGGGDTAAVVTFYVGLAIALKDPAAARRLLGQMDRELGDARQQPAEAIEVHMRGAAKSIQDYLEHTVTASEEH